MKVIIDFEDCKLIENKSKQMLEAYIRYNLKMFKINNIEFIGEKQ